MCSRLSDPNYASKNRYTIFRDKTRCTSPLNRRSAAQYHYRYLHEEDFDNYYVTWVVVVVDRNRALKGLEALLPLRTHERRRYVDPFSPRMTRDELKDLFANLWTLAISGAHTAVAFLLDYTLYRLVTFVRTLGKVNVNAGRECWPNRTYLCELHRARCYLLKPNDLIS